MQAHWGIMTDRRATDTRVTLPYRVACLLYCFNTKDEVLLLQRSQEPNRGLWSPCGGKLRMQLGESPYACACREAFEETGKSLQPFDLHLIGIVSENGYQGTTHWLIFLFEVMPKFDVLPPSNEEGKFAFFHRQELEQIPIPKTDREKIWPLFWRHRGGFFAAHCTCETPQTNHWTIEESYILNP
jgi:8-oxo-dGTP diphosphatase